MKQQRPSALESKSCVQTQTVTQMPALDGIHPEVRRILLAVTGLSPQVITETVYALAVKQNPAWLPDEIHVITTEEGAHRVRLALLGDDKNWFGKLLDDHHLPAIDFSEKNIHVVKNQNGQSLNDIRSPQDNEQVADFICEHVRQHTADDNTELHVSIAGGRKTMGYYLGYALSLFGRSQDRLSHILVSEPFESSWDFFYPTPYSKVIEIRDKTLADTRNAIVTLADIPFVRLRDELPQRLRLQQGRSSFSETVAAAQKAQQQPELILDLTGKTVTASGENIAMEPAELAFYTMMARARQADQSPQRHDSDKLATRYLREYAKLVGKHSGDYERTEKALDSEDIKEWFEQRKSRTNKAIRNALNRSLTEIYQINASGKRPKTRFGLSIPVEAIEFVDNCKLAGDAANKKLGNSNGQHQERTP